MYITEIEADGNLNTALKTFSTYCQDNAAALGLTAGNVTEINGASANFEAALGNQSDAKAAAMAATVAKEEQKRTSRGIVAKWAKTFRANNAISDEQLAALMLAPHVTPGTKTPPAIPQNLVANSDGSGNIVLRWGRNGNIQGTTFVVEHRSSPTGTWTLTGTTTKASFATLWSPGRYVEYRVTASRRGQSSAPSVPAVLWSGGSSSFLSIAA